jgi:hypothetical protein
MSEEFEQHLEKAFQEWIASDSELRFDMYAQDLADSKPLQELIPSLVVTSAGGICPFQAEGMLFGLSFYYRERGGWASLRLGQKAEDCYLTAESLFDAGEEVDEFRSGAVWLDTLINLIPKLEKTVFLYSFPYLTFPLGDFEDLLTVEPGTDPTQISHYYVRAESAAEAFRIASTFEEDAWLTEKGCTSEMQRKWFEARVATMSQIPLKSDERVWPDPLPVFEVNVPEAWRREDGRIMTPWAPRDGA